MKVAKYACVHVCAGLYTSVLSCPQHIGMKPSRGAWRFRVSKKTKEHLQHKEFHLSSLRRTICFKAIFFFLLSHFAASQSIVGQEQKKQMCTVHICLSAIPPAKDYISKYSSGRTVKKKSREKQSSRYLSQILLPKKGTINCLQCLHLLKAHHKWIRMVRREDVEEKKGA